jgi:glycogen operon protein
MLLATRDRTSRKDTRLAVLFNRSEQRQLFNLPSAGEPAWKQLSPGGAKKVGGRAMIEPRSVAFFVEN